jgi:hypothetical protein
MQTETEPIPNLIMGDSERVVGKSKKWKGFLKPNTETLPNRIPERLLPESKGSFVGQRSMTRDDALYYRDRPTPDLHRRAANGNCAAIVAVHIQQSVLVLSAKSGSLQLHKK